MCVAVEKTQISIGRRYLRERKRHGAEPGGRGNQYEVKDQIDTLPTADRLSTEYKVSAPTVKRYALKAAEFERLELEPLIAGKARERQACGQGGVLLQQKSAEPIETRAELATIAGVSHDTIAKVKTIEQKAPEAVKARENTERRSAGHQKKNHYQLLIKSYLNTTH